MPSSQLGTKFDDAVEIPTAPRSSNHADMGESAQGTARFQDFRALPLQICDCKSSHGSGHCPRNGHAQYLFSQPGAIRLAKHIKEP
jgi:hypothetical protein